MKEYETLDPANWQEMRELAHEMVDDAINYLMDIGKTPAWVPMPEKKKAFFKQRAPLDPGDPRVIYEHFKEDILPYPMRTAHPRFWGWYMGNGTIFGSLADFLTSIMNSNAGGGNQVAKVLEDQVIDWMKEITGYPGDASGILVSGGSMANVVGLTVARHDRCGFDIRNDGLLKGGRQLTFYASTEVHSCNQKAIELLGIGSDYLRKIPVNDDYTISLSALESAIKADIENRLHPVCIIASAGTVNTGAIDDLNAIADLCDQYDLWFHVDGAIGAIAMISDKIRPQLSGIERSHSVALDLHKWIHIPFEAGCTLIRNRQAHHQTFSLTPEYLAKNMRGLASGTGWYSEYGLQLSRRTRSLKIWMSIKEHGLKRLARMIERNCLQAHYLGEKIEEHDKLELMAPICLDIVCFRYNPGGKDIEKLNQLNKTILTELHERGIAVPSYTTLSGNYCLRVAIANHRSRKSDFDALIEHVVLLGEEVKDQA